MSQNVPASFQVKFQNNVELVLQTQKSVLKDAVVWTEDKGEKVKVRDLIGNNMPQEADERHGSTKWGNRTHDGVWLPKPNELYDADLIDNADRLATDIDLDGAYTMAAAGTLDRAVERRILEGFYGPIISGKEGTTITPFPAGSIIPVTTGGASGPQRMNTAKLRAATSYLAKQYVDMSLKRYIVLTAEQNDDLLQEVPAASSDFKGSYGGEFMDGWITRLLGWNVIPLELANPALGTVPALSLDGSNYRRTPFWVQGGMTGNWWQKLRTRLGEIPEKLWTTGYLAGTTVAATRTQAGRCGQILNSEA
jgi:hypothetical protein